MRHTYRGGRPPCASCGTVTKTLRSSMQSDDRQDVRELIKEDLDQERKCNWLDDPTSDISWLCVFHRGCWDLLIQHFGNRVLSLDILSRVVAEEPWPLYRVRRPILETGIPDPSCFQSIRAEWEVTTLPNASNMKWENSPGQEVQKSDCFHLLPLEIRFEVAYLLPTIDYLSLRLASKAMVYIFYAQEYWKSRFFIHRERGYLTYLLEEGCEDWLLMYRCTNRPKRLVKKLRFRRLQWLHNEWIKDRCMMYGGSRFIPDENPSHFYGLIWFTVLGNIQCDRLFNLAPRREPSDEIIFCLNCSIGHKLSPRQIIFLPNELVEMAVSVLAEDEHTFITGFCVTYGEELSRIEFGYQIPGKKIMIDFRNRELRGFEVYAGNGGIQAVCPLFKQEGDHCNSVIGKPDSGCYTMQLTPGGEIKAFAGNFDVSQTLVFRCSSSADG